MAQSGRSRVAQDASERRQLPSHQEARRRRPEVPGDGVDRRMGTMGGGKGVVHVHVGQRGQLAREPVVVGFLFG